jgi:hypothetical protein
MTEERNFAEKETMEIIKAIREASRKGGNENILSIAALSYSKGLQDGAEIERSKKTA